ncbi:MAG: hypothetical protein IC227_02505 [Enterococcus lacertideformus]|uniref:Uncharacterized protein n=1 Tax=Enterococcus lacertideformus TaxID=2771493 RepID=A0A931FAI1_9ENTE|nr:hypothetical protein [Enterococcus lacertideformus]
MKKKKLFVAGSIMLGIVIFTNDLKVEATVNQPNISSKIVNITQTNENISTVVNIKPSETLENYRLLLDTFFWISSNQSTGIYKRQGDTLEIYVDESAQQLPTYTITGASLKEYLEG